MPEDTNVEKLASVMNSSSQQGKDNFVKMLWKNQPTDVQLELRPLLNPEAQQVVDSSAD